MKQESVTLGSDVTRLIAYFFLSATLSTVFKIWPRRHQTQLSTKLSLNSEKILKFVISTSSHRNQIFEYVLK